MAIDPTASEFFFRSSLKKYLIDSLKTIEGKLVVFDKTILYDEVRSYNVDEWFVVNFGVFNRSLISKNIIDINCCTRKDSEGIQISHLSDLVIGYLTDITQTDTMRRVPLYDASDVDPVNWTEVGSMLVLEILEEGQNTTADQTKVKTITVVFAWGSVI